MKKHDSLVYSAVGLAALLLVLVAFNYLMSTLPLRADLTEGKLYTLSEGTKKVLAGLEAPVKLRIYVSQGEQAMPLQLRSFAQRVEDMVREFKSAAGSNLIVERYNPKPDSDEEDAAQLDGIEPQQLFSGEQFYIGVSVSRLDRKQAIPVLSPQRERLLEYDLVRAIARVGADARPKIGVMAGMPVMGAPFSPFNRQGADPWVLANELKRDFDVKTVSLGATSIDPEINVLLVIHPRDLPEAAEYALDQFVLRGGKLIAFVDPYAYFDQQQQPMPGMPPQGGSSSSLPRLFKAWGVEMDPGKVLADVVFASGGGQRYTPTVLTLNRSAFNRTDVVTSQIETLLYPFGGAFVVKAPAGLTVTDLVRSSPNSMLVDHATATLSGNAATKGFEPGGKNLPLAIRLTGKFASAFPDGRPEPGAKDGQKPAPPKPEGAAPHLRETSKDNAVILVADVDMLHDGAAVDVQEVFGRKVIVPSNGNLAFALGMVEQVASGDALISLQSRASGFRPLTVVREMEAEAQKQDFGKIKELEDSLQKTSEKMQALQKARGPTKAAQILSPEEQAELEGFKKQVVETRLALKELRKNLRQDAEALVFWTKLVNIALMPLLVALAGIGVALIRRRRQAVAA